jgi:hypothetical protein
VIDRGLAVGIVALTCAACVLAPPIGERQAAKRAQAYLRGVTGAAAVDRARLEVRPSRVGWMVVLRDADAACGDGPFWPGACRFGPTVYRDVYVCVERDGSAIHQAGASTSPRPLGPEDLCQIAGGTPRPPVAPTPLEAPQEQNP